jgi:hypothetical protein
VTFVTSNPEPSYLSQPDPPALYRLGQYLRASLRDPDDRDGWVDEIADADIYSLWQGRDRADWSYDA